MSNKETEQKQDAKQEQEVQQKQRGQQEQEPKPPSYEELKAELSDAIEKARVKSGRSVEDIAYQMNIPVPNLAGMENGSAFDTMEKVFVRGYIINYAKALELDGTGLLELLNRVYLAREGGGGNNEQADESKKPVRAYNLRDLEKTNELPLIKIIPPILITLVIIGGGFYWQLSSPPSVSDSIEVESPEFDQVDSPYVEEYQNATDTLNTQEEDNSEPDVISITFVEESWLEVVDSAGKNLAWQLYGPGQTATFSGEPPYSLVIGNAKGTLVSFNGANINLARFSDQENVARLILPLN